MADNQFAEESYKTRKVREKLKKHLEKIDAQITQQELGRKLVEIHRWISRHAPFRVSLKNKSISLFDENQHAAQSSQKIIGLITQLQKNIYSSK